MKNTSVVLSKKVEHIAERRPHDKLLVSGDASSKPARKKQEVKFKSYYHDLHWALTEYDRVVTEVSIGSIK